jgi:hypothetical protein
VLQIVEVPTPEPGAGEVRLGVRALDQSLGGQPPRRIQE